MEVLRAAASSSAMQTDVHHAQSSEDAYVSQDSELRRALRCELQGLLGDGRSFEQTMRQQVLAALSEWHGLTNAPLGPSIPLAEGFGMDKSAQISSVSTAHDGLEFGGAVEVASNQIKNDVLTSLHEEPDDPRGPASNTIAAQHDFRFKATPHNFSQSSLSGDVKTNDDSSRLLEYDMDPHIRMELASRHFTKFARDRIGRPSTAHNLQDSHDLGNLVGVAVPRRCIHETEPKREGPLADIVQHRYFDMAVRFVILIDCIFMAAAVNESVRNLGSENEFYTTMDHIFLALYTCELVLKLVVHRFFFFFNGSWRMNSYDFLLVCLGFFDLHGSSQITWLRSIRLAKFGKGLRAISVFSEIERLHSFIHCFQQSLMMLFWCLVMLFIVFYLFSLIFMQFVAGHLAELADKGEFDLHDPDQNALVDYFGSVQVSMLTLWQAVSGGDDWSNAYNVISQTGSTGAFVFILFIAFVSVALMNVITGIFVESAMDCLSPDHEKEALDHQHEEMENAAELTRLCLKVDTDESGRLTREQFEDGMRREKIPRLLMLLGLNEENVHMFFDILAHSNIRGDGGVHGAPNKEEVDIRKFVQGCMRLKEPATIFDLQLIILEIKEMDLRVQNSLRSIHRRVDSVLAQRPVREASVPDLV